MRYALYRGRDGDWRWRLVARNGRVVADSGEGYRRRRDCLRGIRLVQASGTARIVAS